MELLDYIVLVGYFLILVGIGIWSSWRIKKQEDYFMGNRSFGKLLQTFAAFGAGTGSSDPVNVGRTTFTSGLSGMWSVMYWLFVTPFYWITGVWYRRMRHLTLGDWFVERYESQALGLGYCCFGLAFFMVYGSMLFTAIGKVAAPLVGIDSISWGGQEIPIEYLLVPIIGVVVLVYGIAGGLEAAYYTDLIQGLCIIALSVILIPIGLQQLAGADGSLFDGFIELHKRLPEEQFTVFGGNTSEFPWYRILAIVLINLVGIVVQPHFIATGGGSAKTEMNARFGLVTGNFLKRFCTVGWVLTGLIALALFANNPEVVADPDKTWGVASRELLWPGLTGLMLACLLAALMSSVDAYMVVGSALVVRNVYAPYINPNASEKQYVFMGRLTGILVVAGAVIISLISMDVYVQLQLTWVFGVLFAAPFWVGMYWRGATLIAAWISVAFCAIMFFLVPMLLPMCITDLNTNPDYLTTNTIVNTVTKRKAAQTDVQQREQRIKQWEEQKEQIDSGIYPYGGNVVVQQPKDADRLDITTNGNKVVVKHKEKVLGKANTEKGGFIVLVNEESKAADSQRDGALDYLGPKPATIKLGEIIPKTDVVKVFWKKKKIRGNDVTGGKSVFWTGGVMPVDKEGKVIRKLELKIVKTTEIDKKTTQYVLAFPEGTKMKGFGYFRADLMVYRWMGVDLSQMSNGVLDTLDLPTKIVTPFLVMILFSFVTPKNKKSSLDRYYVKMNTPVDPNPDLDKQNLEAAYENPDAYQKNKIFPGSSLEFCKPSATDIIGFVASFAVCFAVIALAMWVASIGG